MRRFLVYLLFYSLFYLAFIPNSTRSTPVRQGGYAKVHPAVTRVKAGKQHLFVIAIDRYSQWPKLPGPVSEAQQFKEELLTHYHIDNVKELYNHQATKEAIRNYLVELQVGGTGELKKKDSLIIYFSGHGHAFPEETDNGYWIPYNAGFDVNARSYWLGNAEITGLVKKIQAKQILIISDSCFAATLVDRQRGQESQPPRGNQYPFGYGKGQSRKVLTAGGLERVPGRSEFAGLLTGALYKNQQPYVDIASIYMDIRAEVHGRTGNSPEYGNLKHTAFDPGASFILFTKKGWKELVSRQQKNEGIRFSINVQLGDYKILSLNFNF